MSSYLLTKTNMELDVLVHVGKELESSKEVVERLTYKNIETKLDHYLNKFDNEDAEGSIEVKADKDKKGLFSATIQANLDGQSYRFSREEYSNLDDLINHLFEHFKEELSSK